MNGPSPVRLAVASPSHLRRCDGEAKRGGPPPRLLNPSGAFNDPFYPQIRVKNQFFWRIISARIRSSCPDD